MKSLLIEKLVQELVKGKCIEFTQEKLHHVDEMVFRVRVHAVPDTQVRIIREMKAHQEKK
jgi:hypothetical protein